LGSFAFYHNSQLFVKAASIISSINPDIEFIMVGNGKDKQDCERLANKLKLGNLKFSPPVPKEVVPSLLRKSDIAVLPGSTDIICPIKIMEYMAAGCATLAPDYLCNQEIISHKETGILFSPNDENSLANAILEVINNCSLKLKLETKGQEHVRKNLTWEKTWGSALNHIEKNLQECA